MFSTTKKALSLVSNSVSVQVQQQLDKQAAKQLLLREQYHNELAIYAMEREASLEQSYSELDKAVSNHAVTAASLQALRAKYPQAK